MDREPPTKHEEEAANPWRLASLMLMLFALAALGLLYRIAAACEEIASKLSELKLPNSFWR